MGKYLPVPIAVHFSRIVLLELEMVNVVVVLVWDVGIELEFFNVARDRYCTSALRVVPFDCHPTILRTLPIWFVLVFTFGESSEEVIDV